MLQWSGFRKSNNPMRQFPGFGFDGAPRTNLNTVIDPSFRVSLTLTAENGSIVRREFQEGEEPTPRDPNT